MSVTAALTELITADAAVSPTLGAPGVYFAPASAVDRLDVEAMDVAAFVGTAPRGPAWVPMTDPQDGACFRARSVAVAVDSWDDYVELYGGIEGEMQLAPAVSAYFAQGARRAYIVRVVHLPGEEDERQPPTPEEVPRGCAELAASFPRGETGSKCDWLRVAAANEGSWGNQLGIVATLTHQRLGLVDAPTSDRPEQSWRLKLPRAGLVTRGATLRLTPAAGGRGEQPQYAVVEQVLREPHPVDPDNPITAVLSGDVTIRGKKALAEIVELDLSILDRDRSRRRQEEHRGLGLHPDHPRYICSVLEGQSRLVQVHAPPDLTVLDLADAAGRVELEQRAPGLDLWSTVTSEDFFPGDEVAGTGGLGALDATFGAADEVATIVAPDLYCPPVARTEPLPLLADAASPQFHRCPDRPAPHADETPPPPSRPVLDPRDPVQRDLIVQHQRRLIEAAERMHRVALVDVPPGLTNAQVQAWRAEFDSAFGAAYHPWLAMPTLLGRTLPLAPSAVAAGIIARSELTGGLARGPANVVAIGVVDVDAIVPADDRTVLHRLGVNLFLVDVDGVRLSAARTLSTDAQWRQLSVRRLLLSIERSVRHQLQWCVFENNDDRLRDNLRAQLNTMMAALSARGCFAGSSPEESWFVHIAAAADAGSEQDAGQLVAEIGVAPAEPLEFIVVRVAVQAEGEVKSSFVTGEVSPGG